VRAAFLAFIIIYTHITHPINRTDDDDQALAYFKQTVNQTGLRKKDLAFALAEFHTGNGAKRNLDHAIDNLSKLHQI
jgi:hypothetical protein